MNIKTNNFSEQHTYAAPEITAVDIVADSILCGSSSTEQLVEDNYDPWA